MPVAQAGQMSEVIKCSKRFNGKPSGAPNVDVPDRPPPRAWCVEFCIKADDWLRRRAGYTVAEWRSAPFYYGKQTDD